MSTAQDCAIVSAAFKLSLGSSCCGNGPAVCDASGRVTEIHAGCTQASQWFGGTFPQGLEALPNLRIMFFDNCEMTGPLPDTFGGFSQLFEMHLQGNHFNGPIPPSFAGMISMQYFHIQDNFFIGSIPAGLSSWTILQVGEFQGNCLTGSSPSTKINIGAQKTGCPTSWPPLPAPNPVNNPGPPAVTTSAVATASATNSNVTTKAVAITTAATSSVATTSISVPADSQSSTFPLAAIVGGSILLLLILVALGICYCVRIKTKRNRGGGNPHVMLNDDADGIPMRKPQPIPAAPAAMRDADGKFARD
ncbi:hypothetical protein BCR33DRAFT_780858 [Rhizoclosmatium globosum]|uniref:L domain-like protein n=1 Tax=Rhizoclosmatium globosum TaxID=329046 RepID=A0A1Y2CVB6_9FUNG|nr:hypothetical protein BCR33DRAFT_780858 [Rhizoclosmatium globosum]|eukprot:ORY50978.1 hypothetical protein BCR33DRAFT_780858 [Rhizoclosmatium globosum]